MTSPPADPNALGLDVPERALAIGAHPDDAEFGAGATIARWADAGTEVTVVIVTDGSKGSWDAAVDPTELAAQRREEQHDAAKRLGIARVVFLDEPDGELEYTMDLRAKLCLQVRMQRPDVVLAHDPWQRYQLHPDHRVSGLVALDGVVAARDPLFYPDQGVPHHRPRAVLLWSSDDPDHVEPASTATIDRKVAALLCHSSQAATTMGNADRSERERRAFAARISSWAEDAGARFGIELAEPFKRLTP